MKLLDAYCGEGGAARGYADAGYDIHGIDTNPHALRRYPYDCDQADAIDYILTHGADYDLIHASPPCTGYSVGTAAIDRSRYPRLIAATRAALKTTGTPYIIENVVGARRELFQAILLCGRMFALGAHDGDGTFLVLDRHRLFETPLPITPPPHPAHHRGTIPVGGAYTGAQNHPRRAKKIRGGGYTPHPNVQRRLLDVPWMSATGVRQAIPPAYTHYLGRHAQRLLAA